MSNIYAAPKADLTTDLTKKNKESQVTDAMVDGLSKGAKWAKFLAILGYIGFALIVIAAVLLAFSAFEIGMLGLLIASAYGLAAFIIFKISRTIHKYSNAVNNLKDSYEIYDVMDSQAFFRQYVKWSAIFMIVVFVLSFSAAFFGRTYIAGM